MHATDADLRALSREARPSPAGDGLVPAVGRLPRRRPGVSDRVTYSDVPHHPGRLSGRGAAEEGMLW